MANRKLGMGDNFIKFAYENANGTTGVSAVVHLTGTITSASIRQSLVLLQSRHPLLRASFSPSGDSLEIDEHIFPLPLDIIARNDPEQWKHVYRQHLNQAFALKEGYLWRATYLTGENINEQEHELIVSFHHCVIDGLSIGIFYRDLLNYARIILEGGRPEVKKLPLLPNTEAMLKKHVTWEQYKAGSESGFTELLKIIDQLYSYEKDAPLMERTTEFFVMESNENELLQMLNRVRKNDSTLTSLLSAALLIAVYRVKGGMNSNGRIQVANTPVNMRNNCLPPIGLDNIGPYVSMISTFHYTDRDTSVWDLARSFKESSIKAIEEQSYGPRDINKLEYLQMLSGLNEGPFADKYVLGVGVTNYGVIDLPADYGLFQINKFYSGASRHGGDWLTLLHTATFDNKLTYCFCYEEPLLSSENAGKIIEEFFGILFNC